MYKRIISMTLLIAIVLGFGIALPAYTEEEPTVPPEAEYGEGKVYCTATIEDEFDPYCIIIEIQKSLSEINKDWSVEPFAGLGIASVESLFFIEGDIEDKEYFNPDGFQNVLCLELVDYGKENVLSTIKELEKLDIVYRAYPNYYVDLVAEPTDPAYTAGKQWPLALMQAPDAWNITTGSSSVKVGVIDGEMFRHGDLDNNLYRENNVIKGFDCTVNTVTSYTLNSSQLSHATKVAAIIGAEWNTSLGAGICKNVTIVPFKAVVTSGNANTGNGNPNHGDVVNINRAFNKAQDMSIPIVTCAFAYWDKNNGGNPFSSAMNQYTGLIIASPGNRFPENEAPGVYKSGKHTGLGVNVDDRSVICATYPGCATNSNLISVMMSPPNDYYNVNLERGCTNYPLKRRNRVAKCAI